MKKVRERRKKSKIKKKAEGEEEEEAGEDDFFYFLLPYRRPILQFFSFSCYFSFCDYYHYSQIQFQENNILQLNRTARRTFSKRKRENKLLSLLIAVEYITLFSFSLYYTLKERYYYTNNFITICLNSFC